MWNTHFKTSNMYLDTLDPYHFGYKEEISRHEINKYLDLLQIIHFLSWILFICWFKKVIGHFHLEIGNFYILKYFEKCCTLKKIWNKLEGAWKILLIGGTKIIRMNHNLKHSNLEMKRTVSILEVLEVRKDEVRDSAIQQVCLNCSIVS